jgi:hypothetical protein
MKRDPVRIEKELRQIVVDEMVARLRQEALTDIVGSFDDHHWHGLVQVPTAACAISSASLRAHVPPPAPAQPARRARRHLGQALQADSH